MSTKVKLLIFFLILSLLSFFVLLNLIPLWHKCKKCKASNQTSCEYCQSSKSGETLERVIIGFLCLVILLSLIVIGLKKFRKISVNNTSALQISPNSNEIPEPVIHPKASSSVPPVSTDSSTNSDVTFIQEPSPTIEATEVFETPKLPQELPGSISNLEPPKTPMTTQPQNKKELTEHEKRQKKEKCEGLIKFIHTNTTEEQQDPEQCKKNIEEFNKLECQFISKLNEKEVEKCKELQNKIKK